MSDLFAKFKKQIPEKVLNAGNTDRVAVTVTVSGLTAKAMYGSIGDISAFVEDCIINFVENQGCVLTPDGIVSKKQLKLKLDEKAD